MRRLIALGFILIATASCGHVRCPEGGERCVNDELQLCGTDGFWHVVDRCHNIPTGRWRCCAAQADEYGPAGMACLPDAECSP